MDEEESRQPARDDAPIGSAHSASADEVVASLGVDPATGLSSTEAAERQHAHGRNELEAEDRVSAGHILLDQVRSTVVVLLAVAVVAGFLIGEYIEAIAIAVVLVVNTVVGFVTELRAIRSVEGLRSLASAIADVERDDTREELDAAELVPGDIVSVEAGDQVPADIRLIEASDLTVEEAALTGESAAVEKSTDAVDAESGVGDRTSMLFMGTTVQSGRDRGVVVATGSGTEVGQIATMVQGAESGRAPLQEGLDRLGRTLSIVVVGVTAVLIGIGLLRGLELREVLEVAIALAVAVVPEGLPAVATLTLTVGMRRMARRNALVSRLPTVETLGSTTVVASDKTGTLTTNVMEVVQVELADGVDESTLWETAILANDADISEDGEDIGDPTETALLRAAEEAGVDWRELRASTTRRAEDPFDSESKRMAVVVADTVHAKGAPEALLDEDSPLGRAAEEMGGRALRTLAIGRRTVADGEIEDGTDPGDLAYEGLEILGVVGLQDPPREEAIRALETLRGAGIRVVMVTGDQPRTARAVADQIGIRAERVISGAELAELDDEALAEAIREVDVFARVEPEQKLRIVEGLQAAGEVVAVTGDGVNDAPALRQADVGVAMGETGTDVAREAAAIILMDDDFATIEAAVEEGRRIVANIRRFGQFLFSWHLGIVLLIATSLTAGFSAPLAGLMILWNNLVIDVIPSFALALEPGREDAMRDPPRPKDEPVLGRGTLRRILVQGSLIAGVGLSAFFLGVEVLELALPQAQTMTFVAVTTAQLLAVFNARSEHGSGFAGATRNPFLWAALGITLVLEAIALFVVPLRDVLGLTALPGTGWGIAAALALIPLLGTQGVRFFSRTWVRSP
ncbi:MAG: HAD family hydrolase [Actinobacteria bacterium]|nr:HAD family hydrolase [Actinomycetota bacterium]